MNQFTVNFIYSLKNAAILKKELLYFFYNKNFILLAKLFYKIGLIQDFWLIKSITGWKIAIALKYYYQINELSELKLVSKPSWPFFLSYTNICQISERTGFFIFSTSFGFLTSIDCKKKKIGGKLFFYAK